MKATEAMHDTSLQLAQRKRDWALTERAFNQLLFWLDEGEDSGGQRYMEMRRRLVLYFDRKNCSSPDELADETLNRVARRLEEEGAITTDAPAHYCYIVARFVLLESVRRQQREETLNESTEIHHAVAATPEAREEQEENERRLECLEHCIGSLEPNNRELIIGYYRGEQRAKIQNRTALATRLGVTANALSIRACRIRDKLEACVHKCLQ